MLSDNLDSPMFYLEGVIYTLPVHFSELEANGWRPYDPDNRFATDILEPGDFDIWTLTDGYQYVSVSVTNISEEAMPVSESYITGLAALSGMHDARLIFPGNIMFGSTYEDVMAAHGDTLTHVRESENSLRLEFFSDRFMTVALSISIDNETNLVIFMNMTYWGWTGPRPTPPPPRAESELEKLSDDLNSRMFYLGGVVYTLPVHVSELEANGWTPHDRSGTRSYMIEPGRESLWWMLTDGYNFVDIWVTNLSEEVLPINETYITYVLATQITFGVQPIFPGNITIGAAYGDVLAAYGEPNERGVFRDDIHEEFNVFLYFIDYLRVQIGISKQTNRVILMDVTYWGWFRKPPALEQSSRPEELSDDLDSPMFSLDGVIYTLPVNFSELEVNGWSVYDPRDRGAIDSHNLMPGRVFPGAELVAGDQNIAVLFANLYKGASRPLSESHITDVFALYGMHNAQLIFPGDIMIGSTYEDVIAAHGEPSTRHIPEWFPSLRLYYVSDYFILRIGIDTERNLVAMIHMQHWSP